MQTVCKPLRAAAAHARRPESTNPRRRTAPPAPRQQRVGQRNGRLPVRTRERHTARKQGRQQGGQQQDEGKESLERTVHIGQPENGRRHKRRARLAGLMGRAALMAGVGHALTSGRGWRHTRLLSHARHGAMVVVRRDAGHKHSPHADHEGELTQKGFPRNHSHCGCAAKISIPPHAAKPRRAARRTRKNKCSPRPKQVLR